MMKTDLPNILTAISIILGIITALYGLFFPDIKEALSIKSKIHKIDNKDNIKYIKSVINSKYIPLLIGSILISIIVLPEFYRLVSDSITLLINKNMVNIEYDIMKATFILICLFIFTITISIIKIGILLNKKIKNLNPDK